MGIYRNTAWSIKGFLEYTNSGYQLESDYFNPKDLDVDLSNKAIMITGAKSGIGKQTAFQLAKRGATVYMVCRSKERGQAAQKQIQEKTGNKRVQLLLLDVSLPRDVYKFAKSFLESNRHLDILINNAGCMLHDRRLIEGDIEANFSTNTLGIHILTKTLLPLIAKSPKPRVFMMTSAGMLTEKLDADDLMHEKMKDVFIGIKVYAQNKRQQIVMTDYYAKNYPEIYFATTHPGFCYTPGLQISMPKFWKFMRQKLRTPYQGADTLIWMCCYQDLEKFQNGSFFQDRAPVKKHIPLACIKNSEQDEKKLMAKLDDLYDRFLK